MRMEPRNIGVIVWSNGRVANRYLDEADIDPSSDRDAYRRWVNFWSDTLKVGKVSIARRKPITVSDPNFLNELCKTQKGNYLLYDSGRILDNVHDIEDAADFLFEELVSTTKSKKATVKAKDSFQQICDRLFEYSGLSERDDWKGEQLIPCDVKGIPWELPISYVIGNGKPTAVFQRVHIGRPQSVASSSFYLEWIAKQLVKKKSRRAALVDAKSANQSDPSVGLLDKFAEVIDVSDFKSAMSKVLKIAPPVTHAPKL